MHNKNYYDSKPYITMAVIAANIIVFAVMSIFGNTLDAQYMAEHGAMYPSYVAENGQYWRMFTSMFMHFGLMHILNNMIMLGAVGRIVEIAMGHVRFLIAYIVAGICGSVLSYAIMLHNNDYAVSAGASGAIFGMVGALVWIVIANRGFYAGSRHQVEPETAAAGVQRARRGCSLVGAALPGLGGGAGDGLRPAAAV